MRVEYSDAVNDALENAPASVRKSFFKLIAFLVENLHHPSLRAKKYDEARDRWQVRVNKDWRFYFTIVDDTYHIVKVIPHPK